MSNNYLESSADNIRYNGSGRAFVGDAGGSSFRDLGELDGLNFSISVTTEKLKTTRTADKSVIKEAETEREATLSFGLLEQTEENLLLALLGASISSDNQTASYVADTSTALVDDEYVDLGHVNVFVTKLTGTITGTLECGDSVTQVAPPATGDIAWTESGLVELVNVSGTFVAGEKVELDGSNYITVTGVEVAEDVVVVDAAIGSGTPTTRYVNGTDYSLDADYGYLRKLSAGAITSPAFVSYDHESVSINVIHALSASTVEKKVICVTDKDDDGPRMRYTFHKVKIKINGEWGMIGDGTAPLPMEATVVKDTTQASGQEYYKAEIMD